MTTVNTLQTDLYGLKSGQIEKIKKIFDSSHKVSEVILFGSRAKGNFKAGSDVDLVLKGEGLGLDDILKLHNQLDELDLPYKFDLLVFGNIKDINVIEHIKRLGKTFYKK